jgi:hypothetical protein
MQVTYLYANLILLWWSSLVVIFEALGAGNAWFSVKGNVNEGDTPQAAV